MALVYEPDRDFYKLLGLTATTTASEQIVRQAYLKCARKAHPDRDRTNQLATGNFQDIQEAYETLKDGAKRAKYDKLRLEALRRDATLKRNEARRKDDEAWNRARDRRRGGAQHQYGQEKYFPYDQRAPRPPTSSKPPPGASTAWEEMKRARGGKFGQSAPQPQPQKPANPPQRPGPHPTARTPKKPASQRQGSFAQWAKEQPTPGTPETPGKNGGYRPGGSGMGDEPRAKSNSYQSAKKADPPPSGNGAQDSWESDSDNVESILKSRPRQPYQRVYGERTKLFDGGKGSPEEEGRGRKPFKDAGATPTTPKKGGNSAGSQPFWPHPETTPESTPMFSTGKRSESVNPEVNLPNFGFEKKATDSSGPWFTSEAPPSAFTFTAGSETSDAPPVRKTRSSGHLSRKGSASPAKKRCPETAADPAKPPTPAPESPSLKFNPKEWTETFGPQNFIPRATQPSPVRQARSPLKRSATSAASSTPRRATVTDDTSSDEGVAGVKRNPRKSADAAAPSPNAMDIDSPPPGPFPAPPPAPAPAPTATATSAPTPSRTGSTRTRAVPVEPSKPEWRAGTGKGSPGSKAPPAQPLKPTAGGSEDTDEFRATLDDLSRVPPFAPAGGGLGSLGDLRSSLPFSSRPSESIPVKARRHPHLDVPKAPAAPVFPGAVGGVRPTKEVVQTYVRAFESYLGQWNTYNGIIVDHFRERQKRVSGAVGTGDRELGAAKARVKEQLVWARQDGEVRRRWVEACEAHEKRVGDYLAVLEKMGVS